MYVCHICGKNNAMKNGGWLDKFDNGGSFLGTTNVGRDYSPAWGGQFQKGGKIKPSFESFYKTINPDFNDTSNYNLRQAYKSLPYKTLDSWRNDPEHHHLPDTYKLPNHPTFSDESIYFNPKTRSQAGHWTETDSSWNYEPYDTTVKKRIVEKKFDMGGALPGSVGFTYARTGDIPDNGKYAKKTLASAQNGKEMQFYQQGLDFQPKTISKKGSVIKDDRGQWAHPGEITQIDSNDITMQGVPYPVLGIGADGEQMMMQPGEDYKFNKGPVTEYPMMKSGGNINNLDAQPIEKLDQLTNFTNYNKPTKGGWLDKYQ